MTPNEIRGALVTRGIKIIDLARAVGVTDKAFHQVINNTRPSLKIRTSIARAIGKEVSEIWPDTSKQEQVAA